MTGEHIALRPTQYAMENSVLQLEENRQIIEIYIYVKEQ